MCFHYSLTKERTEIEIQLGIYFQDDWQPIYHANGFSFLKMPVITQDNPSIIQQFSWGLIPAWVQSKADADKLKAQTLNARSETVFEKPSFRSSITHKRCLILADGFFEWMDFNKKKYPHYIHLKPESVFCFAGIFSSWVDKETGELLHTFSILTTKANLLMSKIHNSKQRMPVIVSPKFYNLWLNAESSKSDIQSLLLKPYPDADMNAYTISKLITSRSENSNTLSVIEPFDYPELALLK